jgi:hypothetical protein
MSGIAEAHTRFMNTRRKLAALLGAGALTFTMLGTTASVFATQPEAHKVTICHATASDTHPYVMESVDISSSGAFTGYLKGGHASHTGPIWDATLSAQHIKWGDIVPGYYYAPTDFTFGGLNWSAAGGDPGQALLANDCKVKGEPEEAFIVTEVHLGTTDSSDTTIVNDGHPAVAGDSVHDSAHLEWPGGGELPDGSVVSFSFWTNHDCSGEPNHTSSGIDVAGGSSAVEVEDGLPQGPLAAGSYSYRAVFNSGDIEAVSSASGDCEPFTVADAPPSFEQSQEAETDAPSFEQDQEAVTDAPSEPNTATFGGNDISGPADSAWLLVVALGVLLSSIVVLTPARARTRR